VSARARRLVIARFPRLASIPDAATTVQIMVKDSKKYAATGGWGFGDVRVNTPPSPHKPANSTAF
jgi:hypothetical protein